MISPVPKASSGDELLRLYVRLAADDSTPAASDSEGEDPAEEVKRIRRALEMLDGLRRSLKAGEPRPDDSRADAEHGPLCIGPYRIEREVGRGGWGVVYLAIDERSGREVALKLPLLEYAGHPQFGRRCVREAKLLESLDHPNLITVYEAGEIGWIWYLALEYCAGPNLKQWLSSHVGPVSPRKAAAIVAAVADGLAHVHQRGILHRDIKPTNILLDEGQSDTALKREELSFVPRLVDFGLAKLAASSGETTHEGTLIGTPAYMSPEQALGRLHELSPASDTYALGVVLFELVVGRIPFSGEDDLEIRYRIAKESLPELTKLESRIPAAMYAICRKSLAKDRSERYATAQELAEDLRRFLRGEAVLAPIPSERRVRRVSRRAVLEVAALGAAGAAAVWYWNSQQPRQPAADVFEPDAVPFVPDARLLGNWLFQRSELQGRSIRDRTGRLDAVIQGAYDFVPAGKQQALQFDGQTTVVYLGRTKESLPVPKQSLTAEVWVRIDEPRSWGSFVGLFQDNGSQEHGWYLGHFHDKLSFSLKAAGGQNWMINLVDTTPLEMGAWYHVVGTYDGSTQSLFVNGRLLGESKLESGPIQYPSWGYYELGCYHDVDEFRTMKGCLHEVRVYDSALPAEEIARRFAMRRDKLPNVEAPRQRKARIWTSLTSIFEPNPGLGPVSPAAGSHADPSAIEPKEK